MNKEEREHVESLLSRITRSEWNSFLESESGDAIRRKIEVARAALGEAGIQQGRPVKPVSHIIDLLGDRLLSDAVSGRGIRELIVRSLPPTKWARLRDTYRQLESARADSLHGNAAQIGLGGERVASYWHQGSSWSKVFCEVADLPMVLAERRPDVLPEDETVLSVSPLLSLHDFQSEAYVKLRRLLRGPSGRAAVLALPTGAGKTRVAVEALLDHLAELEPSSRRNVVLWIAQSEELLRQAWDCFREVWQTPPVRADGHKIARTGALSIQRAWGGGPPPDIAMSTHPTVVIAGIQQLASWTERCPEELKGWPMRRFACVVVDEAHRVISKQHREVLVLLGLRKQHHWLPLHDSPPIVGLTATPWRSSGEQMKSLQGFFHDRLIAPKSLGKRPIAELQRRGILARVNWEKLPIATRRASCLASCSS